MLSWVDILGPVATVVKILGDAIRTPSPITRLWDWDGGRSGLCCTWCRLLLGFHVSVMGPQRYQIRHFRKALHVCVDKSASEGILESGEPSNAAMVLRNDIPVRPKRSRTGAHLIQGTQTDVRSLDVWSTPRARGPRTSMSIGLSGTVPQDQAAFSASPMLCFSSSSASVSAVSPWGSVSAFSASSCGKALPSGY